MTLVRKYTVPENAWQGQPISNDTNPPAFIFNTDPPLHFNATNNKLYCDPATTSQPGYVTTGEQVFGGKKTIQNVQNGQEQLALTDGGGMTTRIISNSGSGTCAIGGAQYVDLTTARLYSDATGPYEHWVSLETLRPPCPQYTGFAITVTGDHTFNIDGGTLQTIDLTTQFSVRKTTTIGARIGVIDAYQSAPVTYVYIASTNPVVRMSTSMQSYTTLTDNVALIGVLYKTAADGNDIITNSAGIQQMNSIDFGIRLAQSQLAAKITRMDSLAYDPIAFTPTCTNLYIYAPFLKDTPDIYVPSIADWRMVTGKTVGGVNRTYMAPSTGQVRAYYVLGPNYDGYSTTLDYIPEPDIGCILFLYDPIAGFGYWMPSQATYLNSDQRQFWLYSEYVGRCVKYPGTENFLLLGFTVLDGNSQLPTSRYYKWAGQQPFGAL